MSAGDGASLAVATAGDGITAGGAAASLAAVTGVVGLFAEDDVSFVVVTLATAGDVFATADDGMTADGARVCLTTVAGWAVPSAAIPGNGFGTSTACIAPAWIATRTVGFTAAPFRD